MERRELGRRRGTSQRLLVVMNTGNTTIDIHVLRQAEALSQPILVPLDSHLRPNPRYAPPHPGGRSVPSSGRKRHTSHSRYHQASLGIGRMDSQVSRMEDRDVRTGLHWGGSWRGKAPREQLGEVHELVAESPSTVRRNPHHVFQCGR